MVNLLLLVRPLQDSFGSKGLHLPGHLCGQKTFRLHTNSRTAFFNSSYVFGALYNTNCETSVCPMMEFRSSRNLSSVLKLDFSKRRSTSFRGPIKFFCSNLLSTARPIFSSSSLTDDKRSITVFFTAWCSADASVSPPFGLYVS